jgi:nucleotide-binding universal stress UspA family protein
MRKALVPIDASANALRALAYAISCLGKDPQAELCLVTAHEPPVVYGEIAVYVTEARMAELQRQEAETVLQPAIDMAKAAGIKFTSHVLVGDIASTIARFAELQGCDGIVMGTRGMGAIGNVFLGSIATKVVHLASVPVTLVK